MRVRTIALVVALCAISGALVVACDDKEDSKQTVGNAASPTSRAITSPLAGYEAEAACYGSPGTDEEEDDAIRAEFFDPGGTVRLLQEAEVVQPGEEFLVAVANNGPRPFAYGLGYELERLDGDTWVDVVGEPTAFNLPLLEERPGEVGPCMSVSVPSDAAAGLFRVVMGSGPLLAEFEVDGDPLLHPRWERMQELTARINSAAGSSEEREDLEHQLTQLVRATNDEGHEVRIRVVLDAFNRAANALDAEILCREVLPPSVLASGRDDDCVSQIGQAMKAEPGNWVPLELTGSIRIAGDSASVRVRQGGRTFTAELVREGRRWYLPVFD